MLSSAPSARLRRPLALQTFIQIVHQRRHRRGAQFKLPGVDGFNVVLGGVVVVKIALAVATVAHEDGSFVGDLAHVRAGTPLGPFAAAVGGEQRV